MFQASKSSLIDVPEDIKNVENALQRVNVLMKN